MCQGESPGPWAFRRTGRILLFSGRHGVWQRCHPMASAEVIDLRRGARRAPYGYRLALHILLWCAAGHNPTTSAALFFCSRSRLYGTVQAYWDGALSLEHALTIMGEIIYFILYKSLTTLINPLISILCHIHLLIATQPISEQEYRKKNLLDILNALR